MAQQRVATTDPLKEPHSVSLKVLRLSRPSLSIQHPLPIPSESHLSSAFPSTSASLSYPSKVPNSFIISPLLTLPPAFGSAYVGETFSCTLCANNEIISGASPNKEIRDVRIEAEMKIPSSTVPTVLELGPAASPGEEVADGDLLPGKSLQKVVNFDLKEEGNHVLAVTVTYTESTPTSGRVRTFRKLYQFVCKGCMVVRTKTGALPSNIPGKARKWALEAQLENCGEEPLTLDMVILETRDGFNSQGLNWDSDIEAGPGAEKPILMPGDAQQVCFLVEEIPGELQEITDGKLLFGILSLGWRGPMGNRGFLSTGSLGTRLK